MPNPEKNLYSLAVENCSFQDYLLPIDNGKSQAEQDIHFAMRCNGYFMLNTGGWRPNVNSQYVLSKEFSGQNVSFFGPSSSSSFYRCEEDIAGEPFVYALNQASVVKAIHRFRHGDENTAAKLAYIFGGIVRHNVNQRKHSVESARAVDYVAKKVMLGGEKSATAIASAMSMYIISKGIPYGEEFQKPEFSGQIFYMADSISSDPVEPLKTQDLGLSQTSRLRNYFESTENRRNTKLPDIRALSFDLENFPTVGAEFHLSPDAVESSPDLWERLALLNMSQYQEKSYIQLSRNDRGVIEVRMNPSIYPVTVANWRHMKKLLPELSKSFFTATINRQDKKDFKWDTDEEETKLLRNLQAVGLFSYADWYKNIPMEGKSEEIDFGSVYLGQTLKIHNGKFEFTGIWDGGEGNNGQMGIYTGFGENLSHLVYYLSMALDSPHIMGKERNTALNYVSKLEQALSYQPEKIRNVFRKLDTAINSDTRLSRARISGLKIANLLSPETSN